MSGVPGHGRLKATAFVHWDFDPPGLEDTEFGWVRWRDGAGDGFGFVPGGFVDYSRFVAHVVGSFGSSRE